MKIYTSGGFREYSEQEFLNYIQTSKLKLESGIISEAWILERKKYSNKGNALEAIIDRKDNYTQMLNIGGNPIGTGYKNYIQFLKEMECKSFLGIYDLNSLKGKSVVIIECGPKGFETLRGYVTPKALDEIFKYKIFTEPINN